MKLRKLIGGLTLGIVTISSAIAGFVSVKNKVASEPVQTEATAVPMGIYVAFGNSSSWKTWGATLSNISVYFYGGSFGNPDWSVKYAVNTTTGYVATPENNGNRPTNCIICAWGGGNNNQSDDLTIQTNGNCVWTISGTVSDGKQPGSWGTKSSTTSKTLYIDASKWTSIGSYTPYCHYWDNQYAYDNAAGSSVTTVSGGGTLTNTKWWKFSITCRDTSSLKFLFMYNNYSMQTGDITYNSSVNAYYLSATKSAAPEDTFTCDGTIYKVVRYKKLGSNTPVALGTDYVLGGESYQIPSIPAADTGYSAPSKWNTASDGSGTSYTPSTQWISNMSANKELYAIYTSATYTITYDRNNAGASSTTATRTKEYNVAHIILNPSSDLSWSPSADKRFIGWADSRDGTATHSVGDSYTTNAAKTFYYNEDWYNYRYKIGSGSWINLNHNDTDKPDGVKAQFQSSSAQLLSKGSILTFQYSTDGGTNWSSLSINTFEGNYSTSTGIKDQTTDTIYLKLNDDSSNKYSVWVPGVSERTICVTSSSSATSGTYYNMKSNGYTEVVTVGYVYIQKGQFIKRGWGTDLYETILETGGASSYFSQVDTETAIECKMTGAYTVYNKAGSYSNWKDVYITRSDSESAKYLAQLFNSSVSTICTGITGGSKSLSDLQAIWGSTTTSDLYKHFNGQPTATTNYFKTSASTSDTDILACVAKYDYIINKYGKVALPDFLGRNNSYPDAPQGRSINLVFNTGTNNSTVVIIIVSTLVVVSAVGGYFLLRKRKEQ